MNADGYPLLARSEKKALAWMYAVVIALSVIWSLVTYKEEEEP